MLSFSGATAEEARLKVAGYVADLRQENVGDEKTHHIGLASRRGLIFLEKGDIAIYRDWQTFDSDADKLERKARGYGLILYPDGSSTLFEFQETATSQLPWWFARGRTDVNGKITYIKGTGRFQGIHGTGSYTGRGITPYAAGAETSGDFFLDFQVDYDLP